MRGKVAIIGAMFLAAACGGKEGGDGEEGLQKGQTVATVDGKDITIHELNAELAGLSVPQGEQRKQVEVAALQSLVGRTILADIARERGIDKSPSYLMQKRRAGEVLLVQMLQNDIASKIAPPTRAEAEAFIQQNPDLFAQRRIYALDQIQFQAPDDVKKVKALEPLTTMEQVEQQLIQDRMKYQRGQTRLDTVGTNPELIRRINGLPAGEIFVVPARGMITVNRVTGTQVQPFTGEDAVTYAMNLMQSRRVNEALKKELESKVEAARSKVKYQNGFAPPAASGTAAPKATAR